MTEISFALKTSMPDWAGYDDHMLECNCQWCDPEFHLDMAMDWDDAFELEPPFQERPGAALGVCQVTTLLRHA